MKRHVRYKAVAIGLVIGAVNLPVPVLAQRQPVERPSYDEILAGSKLVVMGNILSSQVVKLKNEPRPMPQAKIIKVNGLPLTIHPDSASWDLATLMDPPRLYALRIQLQPQGVFRGGAPDGDIVQVNLWYGISDSLVRGGWNSYRNTRLEEDDGATLILHLKPAAKSLAVGAGGSSVFELVNKPWLILPSERAKRHDDMEICMRRFEAFKEIEALMSGSNSLTDAEFARLKQLALSEDPGLGKVAFSEGEQAVLDRLFIQPDSSQRNIEELRTWWESEKRNFIDLPLRLIVRKQPR